MFQSLAKYSRVIVVRPSFVFKFMTVSIPETLV